ncbi:MAG TPA: alanine racemase [Bryobacteraceae bacterium]|nr:alanine racemase [Bryobacterales bacterium]HRJ17757.1 alanine racemase [Bryobacteraceae bacterium]
MHISELETPALVIDLDIMDRNLARVANYAREHNLRLRPHTKTHKIPALGRRQLDLGAVGLTVAKTTEAEVMLDAAPEDLLIAYPVLGQAKLERLRRIARKTRVTIALDSLEAARPLSDLGVDLGVLVEVDLGLGRTGAAPTDVPSLVQEIVALPHLDWEGLAFYPGHIKGLTGEDEAKSAKLRRDLHDLLNTLTALRLVPRIVSGGSTPLLFHSHTFAGVNEIRPGTYIFNDLNTAAMGACSLEDCAATILATVVSRREGHMIIDGGSKTFSSDRLATGGAGFGLLPAFPGAVFHKMNEEHGYVDIHECQNAPAVGERVQVLPNHICVAVNLHEQVYGIRGGEVVETWTVAGRGKLQ